MRIPDFNALFYIRNVNLNFVNRQLYLLCHKQVEWFVFVVLKQGLWHYLVTIGTLASFDD